MENKIKNFRDIATLNLIAKSGFIYRTSTLTHYQNDADFFDFLKEKNIYTIIDLRAEREILDDNYTDFSKTYFNYIHAPFDPWNQSIEFQNTHHQGTNVEIAYRFFGLECKKSIKIVVETILQIEHSLALHCHAGKDRTGIIIAILYLLLETPENVILNDYLASEMDTKPEYLKIIFEIITNQGGASVYLQSCDLNFNQIFELKQKISK